MSSIDEQLDRMYVLNLRRKYESKRAWRIALCTLATIGAVGIPTAFLIEAQASLLVAIGATLGAGTAAIALLRQHAARRAKYTTFARLLNPQALREEHFTLPTRFRAIDEAMALIQSWGTFEHVAGTAIRRAGIEYDHLRPASAIDLLARAQLVDRREQHLLWLLLQLRNAVAHGDPADAVVPPDAVALLQAITTRITDRQEADTTGSDPATA